MKNYKYMVTIYRAGEEPLVLYGDQVMVLNSESYGDAERVGGLTDEDVVVWVYPPNVQAVIVERQD